MYNADVKECTKYSVDGGTGRIITQQCAGTAAKQFINLAFPSTMNDIPKGTPIVYNKVIDTSSDMYGQYVASLATGAEEYMAITEPLVIPCSELADGDYYYAWASLPGSISEVRHYSTDVDGGATTFNGVFTGPNNAPTLVPLTGTNIAVTTGGAATGTGTAFTTELSVGDWVKITDADETLWAKVTAIASDTGMTLSVGPAVAIETSTAKYKVGPFGAINTIAALSGTKIAVTTSGACTGTGTAFNQECKIGDWIKITDADETFYGQVISIASQTSMQLSQGPLTAITTSTAEAKLYLDTNASFFGMSNTFLGEKHRINDTGTCAATATSVTNSNAEYTKNVNVGDILVATLSTGDEAAALVTAVTDTAITINAAFSASYAISTTLPLYVRQNLVMCRLL